MFFFIEWEKDPGGHSQFLVGIMPESSSIKTKVKAQISGECPVPRGQLEWSVRALFP